MPLRVGRPQETRHSDNPASPTTAETAPKCWRLAPAWAKTLQFSPFSSKLKRNSKNSSKPKRTRREAPPLLPPQSRPLQSRPRPRRWPVEVRGGAEETAGKRALKTHLTLIQEIFASASADPHLPRKHLPEPPRLPRRRAQAFTILCVCTRTLIYIYIYIYTNIYFPLRCLHLQVTQRQGGRDGLRHHNTPGANQAQRVTSAPFLQAETEALKR